MKKINKSVLFKMAWNLLRIGACNTFSEALRAAWRVMKGGRLSEAVRVKSWFMNKNFTQNERYAISCSDDPTVTRETEKAVLLKWVSKFGTITRWVPKSCLC